MIYALTAIAFGIGIYAFITLLLTLTVKFDDMGLEGDDE